MVCGLLKPGSAFGVKGSYWLMVFSTHGGTFGAKDAIGSLSSRFQNIDCTVHVCSELFDEGWGSRFILGKNC